MTQATPEILFSIRATRAAPPGRATEPERREVFAAALAQFDELLAAARDATPQTRALALFYALSQAGRAIGAAHLEEPWRMKMHGLGTSVLTAKDCRDVVIEPRRSESEEWIDSFSGVARAIGSPTPSQPITIGQLWATLPGLFGGAATYGPEPLPVEPAAFPTNNLANFERVFAIVEGLQGSDPSGLRERLEDYPAGADATLWQTQGIVPTQYTPHGSGVCVWWPALEPTFLGHQRTLDRHVPIDQQTGRRWLRPGLADGSLPAPLMIWWALLFGLSMLTRYEPAGWATALDYDSSELAAPLAQLLETGQELVPQLVIGALLGGGPRSADPPVGL